MSIEASNVGSNSIGKSGFWNYKHIFFPLSIAVPLVLEGGILLHQCFKNRKTISRKFHSIKNSFSLKPVKGEACQAQANRRLLKTILKVIFASTIIAGIAASSFYLLPTTLAISVALTAIVFIAKTFVDPKWIGKALTNLKNKAYHMYKQKPEESKCDFRKRLLKNVALTFLVATVAAAAIYFTHILAGASLFVHAGSNWIELNPIIIKAISSPVLVIAGYFTMATISIARAVDAFIDKNYARGVFHLVGGLAAAAFPIAMLAGVSHLSWGQSGYGVLATLLPLRGFNVFGMLVCLDSTLHLFSAPKTKKYDYSNIFVEKAPIFAMMMYITTFMQMVISQLFSEEKSKEIEDKAKCLA